jgi:hypothetical protein
MKSTARERHRISRHFQKLCSAPLVRFPPSGDRLDAPDKHGVYVIVHRRRGVLHVGRTVSGKRGLFQRLQNHLHGRSSFTVQFAFPEGIDVRAECRFRYITLASARSRALLEAYAVGFLCPAHIGDGTGDKRGAV